MPAVLVSLFSDMNTDLLKLRILGAVQDLLEDQFSYTKVQFILVPPSLSASGPFTTFALATALMAAKETKNNGITKKQSKIALSYMKECHYIYRKNNRILLPLFSFNVMDYKFIHYTPVESYFWCLIFFVWLTSLVLELAMLGYFLRQSRHCYFLD